MLAALLALSASLLWGTSDFLGGLQSRRTTIWTVALVSQSAALVTVLIVLVARAPAAPHAMDLVAPVIAGLALTVTALAEYRAMSLAPISVVAPIFAGAAVFPALWGIAHGDRPGGIQLAGMVLTITGIVLMSRPESGAREKGRPVTRNGVLLAVLAAFTVGVALIAYDYGGNVDPYWTVGVARLSALLLLVVVLAVRRPGLQVRRKTLPAMVLVGVLLAAANVLFTAATTIGLLSVVAVLGMLGPGVTVVWAQALLHERLRPVQWLAAALVLAGVLCLALG
jgi:drug/metabolite transporter (DMT)-like permease